MTTTTATRRRLSPEERSARDAEALQRAQSGRVCQNDVLCIHWATDRGYSDPQPRVNMLTYNAWRAAGRQVRKGEKGCKLAVFGSSTRTDENGKKETVRRMFSATVFHIEQTDPIG